MKSGYTFWQKVRRRIGVPAGADIATDIAAVSTNTANISTQISTIHAVPAQDATANTDVSDAVGNKTDAAVTTVGTTKSLIGYIKGCINQLASIKAVTDTQVAQVGTIVVATESSASSSSVLSINETGVLKSITQVFEGSQASSKLSLTIGGTVYFNETNLNKGMGAGSVSLLLDIPFSGSVLIAHAGDGTRTTTTIVSYTYVA